jgi:hypothetical protein
MARPLPKTPGQWLKEIVADGLEDFLGRLFVQNW